MASLLQGIGNWPGAVWLQDSGTAYLFVNATHILGIGLLIGAILPLDLRLLGLFRKTSITAVGPFLSRVGATGLAIAVPCGLWLFTVKPDEYIQNTAFLCKAALLTAALINIAFQHGNRHYRVALEGGAIHPRVRAHALISLLLWPSILIAGRWIGFL